MVIANPIYDVVFKRMMENERVAKFFIATLLEQTIETVEVKPQEFTYTDELAALAVFRLDFIATIKTESGEHKKVLIEIQKAKNQIDLMRFRNYLAEQYKKEDTIINEKVILPITTIYILGFTLPEIETPCLKVERNYKDQINKTILSTKSDFVEKLTHDSYIVQVERITDRYQTRLDKLLSIFEQTNFVDEKKIIKEFNHEVDIEEIKIATDILHHSGTNTEEKKKIETEQEAWRTVDALTGGLREKTEKILKELEESRKELEESRKALEENLEALTEKDQALTEKDQLIAELMKKLDEMK
ncbi:MAG: hypothetical protein ACKVOU_02100 [Cytophagales bacterium]